MLVAYLYLPLPSFTFGKLLVSVTALLLSQLSALFTWLGGAAGSHARFNLLYRWPPCQLLNFTFGMSVGQLARDEAVLAWRGWPWLVDLAAVALCLSLLLAHLYVPILPGCVESVGLGACTTAGSIQRQNGAASTSSGSLGATYSSAPCCLAGAPAAARAAL